MHHPAKLVERVERVMVVQLLDPGRVDRPGSDPGGALDMLRAFAALKPSGFNGFGSETGEPGRNGSRVEGSAGRGRPVRIGTSVE